MKQTKHLGSDSEEAHQVDRDATRLSSSRSTHQTTWISSSCSTYPTSFESCENREAAGSQLLEVQTFSLSSSCTLANQPIPVVDINRNTSLDRDTRVLTNHMMKYIQLQHQILQWFSLPVKIITNMNSVAKSITPVGINKEYIKSRDEAFEEFNRIIHLFTIDTWMLNSKEVMKWLSQAQLGDTKMAFK